MNDLGTSDIGLKRGVGIRECQKYLPVFIVQGYILIRHAEVYILDNPPPRSGGGGDIETKRQIKQNMLRKIQPKKMCWETKFNLSPEEENIISSWGEI
jgi:hypothetical protein